MKEQKTTAPKVVAELKKTYFDDLVSTKTVQRNFHKMAALRKTNTLKWRRNIKNCVE